jgi:tetratricopeptide (TPR) repeat protein
MSDRPRHLPNAAPRDPPDDADGGDRESRVEELLLAGLDQYFAGRYEQAIDVWTRVAFLDRRNSRAKAYIDRARGLVAERQREVEALVQEGVAAYQGGDLTAARALLTKAVDRGGHSETAQLFLERLHRSEVLPGTVAPPPSRHVARSDAPAAPTVWSRLATAAVCVTLAAAILVAARPVASFVAELPIAMPAAVPAPPEPLPLARPSDRVLADARALRAQGRHVEALRALEAVDVADSQRPAADALRAEIQRTVLANMQVLDVTPEAAR